MFIYILRVYIQEYSRANDEKKEIVKPHNKTHITESKESSTTSFKWFGILEIYECEHQIIYVHMYTIYAIKSFKSVWVKYIQYIHINICFIRLTKLFIYDVRCFLFFNKCKYKYLNSLVYTFIVHSFLFN